MAPSVSPFFPEEVYHLESRVLLSKLTNVLNPPWMGIVGLSKSIHTISDGPFILWSAVFGWRCCVLLATLHVLQGSSTVLKSTPSSSFALAAFMISLLGYCSLLCHISVSVAVHITKAVLPVADGIVFAVAAR